MLTRVWKVMKISNGTMEEIGEASAAVQSFVTLLIAGHEYEVVMHEGAGAEGWIYVTPVSDPHWIAPKS
jgi:hypothetical protein